MWRLQKANISCAMFCTWSSRSSIHMRVKSDRDKNSRAQLNCCVRDSSLYTHSTYSTTSKWEDCCLMPFCKHGCKDFAGGPLTLRKVQEISIVLIFGGVISPSYIMRIIPEASIHTERTAYNTDLLCRLGRNRTIWGCLLILHTSRSMRSGAD